jgi:hypothetical protein
MRRLLSGVYGVHLPLPRTRGWLRCLLLAVLKHAARGLILSAPEETGNILRIGLFLNNLCLFAGMIDLDVEAMLGDVLVTLLRVSLEGDKKIFALVFLDDNLMFVSVVSLPQVILYSCVVLVVRDSVGRVGGSTRTVPVGHPKGLP